MTRILMVCLGNICRSPLAHGILESKLNNQLFYVDSAGTAAYHVGNKPDHRSIQVALNNDIDISTQSARQFKVSDFDTFDFIYAMDSSNYNNIISLARNNEDLGKVKLFLEENTQISNKNVPDPYYGDISDFEYVFDIIEATSTIMAKKLQKTNI
ncbi:low molecular weight protein-tyrosine-phosphatase [Winogradskyella sp.]|jgi:protein-tyrosine phosphatase|uniref:low molecular weight protein-tyrosine-phosphatase n=1 Tax=Winogradskyella sp. TaxID=1883156 RepID=UPI0025D25E0D|nr:low molecular weight protein-tyrosine-phosphatase [Winogradskyella sp.]MCT4628672.1 low molecular weight phosphotyrosine protein phosphatase [Winogradskyella sp.]